MNLKELEQWTKQSLNSCIELGYNKNSYKLSLFGSEAFLRKEKWHIEKGSFVRFKICLYDAFFMTDNHYYFVYVYVSNMGFINPKIEYCNFKQGNQQKYLIIPAFYGDHKFN